MAIRSARTKSKSIISSIVIPRYITLIALVFFGSNFGFLLWEFFPQASIAWASGVFAPFCTMCATLVWASREKVDDLIDPQNLSSEECERIFELSQEHRGRVFICAPITMIYALISAAPGIALQFGIQISMPMSVIAGGAVGAAIYSYLLANSWDEQIRRFKSEIILQAIRKMEIDTHAKEIKDSEATDIEMLSKIGHGWSQGGSLKLHPPA